MVWMCAKESTTFVVGSKVMRVIRITVYPDLTDVAVRGIVIFNGQEIIVHWYGCLCVTISLAFAVKLGQIRL